MRDFNDNDYIENALFLPCPSCGSQLAYSAKNKRISCGHCGHQEEISHANDKVIEQELSSAVAKAGNYVPEESGKKVLDCGNCGAKFMVESTEVKVSCGFCGSKKVNVEAFEHRFIQPVGIIPFYISKDEAMEKFQDWVKKGWFRPSKLNHMANIDELHGIYLPFWTYDAQTESDWSGDAGYFVASQTGSQVMRTSGGRVRVNSGQRQVRWERRRGHLSHFFDDILVVASGGLEQKTVEQVLPYRFAEVVNYDPRFLVGWETEIYSLEVDQGYQIANQIMDYKLHHMCRGQVGGDTQRNVAVHSLKTKQTFKHIILPIWMCSYVYKDKIYRFMINGQTGKVSGKKPWSWIKIILFVLFIAMVVATIWYLQENRIINF